MSHVPHELSDEFPDALDALHALKLSNGPFTRLSDRYHELNREIHRIDAGLEAASDDRTETLKKERLQLLDEIAVMIGETRAGAVK